MRSEDEGLFDVLTKLLKEADGPLDCVQLFDRPEVRQYARSSNRVSDYLAGLWRKGKVLRVPTANEGSKVRFAYQWKHSERDKALYQGAAEYRPRVLADRPSILITEEGGTISIELSELMIVIKTKK